MKQIPEPIRIPEYPPSDPKARGKIRSRPKRQQPGAYELQCRKTRVAEIISTRELAIRRVEEKKIKGYRGLEKIK